MSRFFSEKYNKLIPYTPGEQPKDNKYIKLNTNESPYPPSKKALDYAIKAAGNLQLYPNPECHILVDKASSYFSVNTDEVIFSNGSDELLNFAFMAFCDKSHPAVFPDITYGFYKVFANLNSVPYTEIPLNDNFKISTDKYCNLNKTIFIANPNAPTGIALDLKDIEKIINSNPDSVIVVDEAYVDFGCESCIPLIHKYDNLLVIQTFSKSRSMAGARLGMGFASKSIIEDLNAIKYSTNPYNINSMTMYAGAGALDDKTYMEENCLKIIENRKFTETELKKCGFILTESSANFVFARHTKISGEDIYKKLRENGILVRHFCKPRISEYNRITIGNSEQMHILIDALKKITEEEL